jgi:hypothetical protein
MQKPRHYKTRKHTALDISVPVSVASVQGVPVDYI